MPKFGTKMANSIYKIRKVRMEHLLTINDWANAMKKVIHMKYFQVILFNLVLMLQKIIEKVRL